MPLRSAFVVLAVLTALGGMFTIAQARSAAKPSHHLTVRQVEAAFARHGITLSPEGASGSGASRVLTLTQMPAPVNAVPLHVNVGNGNVAVDYHGSSPRLLRRLRAVTLELGL